MGLTARDWTNDNMMMVIESKAAILESMNGTDSTKHKNAYFSAYEIQTMKTMVYIDGTRTVQICWSQNVGVLDGLK